MNERPTWRRVAIGSGLVALLIAVYFITYSGYAISRDEWFLFDATESFARRGDLRLNFLYDANPPVRAAEVRPPVADTEPLQPVLAAPLFLIAQALPGIGLVHTVFLFNILITGLIAATFFAYGLALGYRARVAALAAAALGLGTILWPYSRTFFREPLFTWLVLLSALLMRLLRQRLAAGQRPIGLAAAFAVALAGALITKEATFLLLPVLVVEALPARLGQIRVGRRAGLALVLLAVLVVVLLIGALNADTLFGLSGRYAFADRLEQARGNLSDMARGVRGYLFSPARSLWVFSPVLLLGLAGLPRLGRARRWRQIAVPLVMLAAFVIGYAIVRGPEWYGGLGWGPRYLVPVTPFVALWLLPVIEALLERGAAWALRLGALLIVLISAAVQVIATLLPVDYYYDTLARQDPPIVPWNEGAWSLRWSPLWVYVEALDEPHTVDWAWQYAAGRSWLLPVLAAALAVLAVGALVMWIRCRDGARSAALGTVAGLSAAVALVLGVGLYAIRLDPRYYGDFAPTRDLLRQLEAQARPGDVIVLNDNFYAEFFMNYYKRRDPAVWTLPQSPGERGSLEQAPQVESPNPDDLIHLSNTLTLNHLAQRHERLWLVLNTSRFIPWSVRAVEHYLARHYFSLGEIYATDVARAVLFDTAIGPPATALAWPEQRADVVFGESLHLVGYDLPRGRVLAAGESLPVSLLWQAVDSVDRDYTVGVLLLDASGSVVAQRDSFPVSYFEHTQQWRTGSYHRDNYALALPDMLPPGDYALWVVVYWWEAPGDRLPVSGPDGEPQGDHAWLGTITVQ
ncbi:MAG: hypothetical protein GXY36_10365 [Chloroflexi bacterium]|nr:hypothetical protein [Chloroflexota bacterium]